MIYIKHTHKIEATSILIAFDVWKRKEDILLSIIGSISPESKWRDHLKTKIVISGDKIDRKISNNPAVPTAFFIKIELAIIKLNPSLK